MRQYRLREDYLDKMGKDRRKRLFQTPTKPLLLAFRASCCIPSGLIFSQSSSFSNFSNNFSSFETGNIYPVSRRHEEHSVRHRHEEQLTPMPDPAGRVQLAVRQPELRAVPAPHRAHQGSGRRPQAARGAGARSSAAPLPALYKL